MENKKLTLGQALAIMEKGGFCRQEGLVYKITEKGLFFYCIMDGGTWLESTTEVQEFLRNGFWQETTDPEALEETRPEPVSAWKKWIFKKPNGCGLYLVRGTKKHPVIVFFDPSSNQFKLEGFVLNDQITEWAEIPV